MKTTLASRMIAARNHAGVTRDQLAARVHKLLRELGDALSDNEDPEGFIQQQISKLEQGIDKSTGFIVHIAVACGVSPRWLALGNSPMVQEEATFSREALQIALTYEQLDAGDQSYFRGLAMGLKKRTPRLWH